MKKFVKIYFFYLLSIVLVTTLTGCNSQDKNLSENSNTTTSLSGQIIPIMKAFSDEINKDYSIIKKGNFDWYNMAEYDYENNQNNGFYNIDGYSLSASGIKNLPNNSKIFDGWYVMYIGDEIGGATIQYSKDNIICSYYNSLEQDIPYELLEWDGDYENEEEVAAYNKSREDFYEKATYEISLDCGYMSESTIQFKDFYYNGEGMEPFRVASFRGNMVNLFTPAGIIESYVETLKKDKNEIIFKGYNVNGKLEKIECIDEGKGDTHEYKVSFDIKRTLYGDDGIEYNVETNHYEGCADGVNSDFVIGEEGTLKNFAKKTHYQYKGKENINDISYTISEIIDNYMSVNMYYLSGNQYDNFQLIMQKIKNRWIVLFEGNGYEIGGEECEELNQYDNNLMDMFFLKNCPRG